jgi:hypothetical protein
MTCPTLRDIIGVRPTGGKRMIRNAPKEAAVFGVDLGKNLFHVVGLDARGSVVQRAKFRRDTVLAFFQCAAPTLVGMEACPGSQWFARRLQAFGHEVRIVPAQFVKPFMKSQKNDTIDAEAIAEAVTRPTMRFTQVRTIEQIDVQALHRMRDQLVSSRTRLVNQARAFCLEYGIAMRQGIGTRAAPNRNTHSETCADRGFLHERLWYAKHPKPFTMSAISGQLPVPQKSPSVVAKAAHLGIPCGATAGAGGSTRKSARANRASSSPLQLPPLRFSSVPE